jgi:hypothetical protein
MDDRPPVIHYLLTILDERGAILGSRLACRPGSLGCLLPEEWYSSRIGEVTCAQCHAQFQRMEGIPDHRN